MTHGCTEREARAAAESCVRALKEQFGVREVYLLGSLAGQSPWHSRSDIDLAVEGLPPEKYISALSALYQLVPEGLEVDLITLEDAPPELLVRAKGDMKMPEDPKEALKKDVADELSNLDRVVEEANLLLKQLPKDPSFVEIRAAGSLVHDFYTGIERIFERIAIRLGPGLPVGEGWHTLLLRAMESGVEGVRPAVIDHEVALNLLDYLRFRHLFRHTYGYELQWDKLQPLLHGLEATSTRLHEQIGQFIKALQQF